MATLGLTLTTAQGIEFEELAGSPVVEIGPQGVTAQRMFRVPWSDWNNFAGELFGVYKKVGGSIAYTTPLPFPDQSDNLLVEKVRIEPFDGKISGTGLLNLTSGLASYPNGAKITATYIQKYVSGGDNPTPPDGVYMSYMADHGVEYTTVPGGFWEWTSDGKTLSEEANTGIVVPVTQHRLTMHNVLSVPESAISSLSGQVNSATFLGKAVGTMLFMGCQRQTQFAFSQNEIVWQLNYLFAERSTGWNKFWRYEAAGGSHWAAVQSHDAGNTKPYTEASFTPLFQYP